MNNFYLLYCLWLVCCGFNGQDMLHKIQEMRYKDTHTAMILLDSLRQAEKMNHFRGIPEFKLDIVQGNIYHIMIMDRLALKYWEKALQTDSVQVNDSYYFTVVNGILGAYYRMQDYENALKYVILLLERGEKTGDEWSIGNCYFIIGQIEWNVGKKQQAYVNFEKALKILEGGKNPGTKKFLSYVYGEIMTMADGNNDNSYMLEIGLRREKLLKEMNKLGGEEGYIDQQRGYLYAKLAYLYQKMEQSELARFYFYKFRKTHFSLTLEGRDYSIPYLQKSGQYKRVLCLLEEKKQTYIMFGKDTIDIGLRVCYENMSETYANLRQYGNAYNYMKRALILTDSLQSRKLRNQVAEMSILYDVSEKKEKIREQEKIIERNKTFITELSYVALCGTLVLIGVGVYARMMRSKNRILARKIKEGLFCRRELRLYKSEYKVANGKEKKLFQNMERLVTKERLFLQANLNRDEMVNRLFTNKNQLANAIRFCTGGNFTEYINGLRLEYALEFLMSGNEKIEVVSEKAGFGSARSFYRIFKDNFGLSPTEYRRYCTKDGFFHPRKVSNPSDCLAQIDD